MSPSASPATRSWMRFALPLVLLPGLLGSALENHSQQAPHSALAGDEAAAVSHPLQPLHLEGADVRHAPRCVACLLRLASGAGLPGTSGFVAPSPPQSRLIPTAAPRASRPGSATRGGRSPPAA